MRISPALRFARQILNARAPLHKKIFFLFFIALPGLISQA